MKITKAFSVGAYGAYQCRLSEKLNETFMELAAEGWCVDSVTPHSIGGYLEYIIIYTTDEEEDKSHKVVKEIEEAIDDGILSYRGLISLLLHKQTGCPIGTCLDSYDEAIKYLRSKSKVKGGVEDGVTGKDS